MIRLHVAAALAAGARVEAAPEQVHYLKNVMRRAAGDEILLFNGRDGEWRAAIDTLERKDGGFTVAAQSRPQTREAGPTLLLPAIKRAPLEWTVEKATELGVAAIQIVTTRRTNSERVNMDRLRAIATEAAEQCERLTVPELRAARALIDLVRDWPAGQHLYAMDETGKGVGLMDALAAAQGLPAFLIGPEGGFEQTELDALEKLNFVTAVDLGPRILRAETAALAALACWQAIVGDREVEG
jgi:16S rRNA (uracil1498-N3)-methyltransferase